MKYRPGSDGQVEGALEAGRFEVNRCRGRRRLFLKPGSHVGVDCPRRDIDAAAMSELGAHVQVDTAREVVNRLPPSTLVVGQQIVMQLPNESAAMLPGDGLPRRDVALSEL